MRNLETPSSCLLLSSSSPPPPRERLGEGAFPHATRIYASERTGGQAVVRSGYLTLCAQLSGPCPKTAGDCPGFAQSAEQIGTVPLAWRFSKAGTDPLSDFPLSWAVLLEFRSRNGAGVCPPLGKVPLSPRPHARRFLPRSHLKVLRHTASPRPAGERPGEGSFPPRFKLATTPYTPQFSASISSQSPRPVLSPLRERSGEGSSAPVLNPPLTTRPSPPHL